MRKAFCAKKYTVADGRPAIPPSSVQFNLIEYQVLSIVGFQQLLLFCWIKQGYKSNFYSERSIPHRLADDCVENQFTDVLYLGIYPTLIILSLFSAVLRYARNVKKERDEVFEQELYVQKKNNLHTIGGDSDDDELEP